MITTINGINRIFFKEGKLFFNGIQVDKDVVFEFKVNKPEEFNKEDSIIKDSSILEINVHDSIKGVDKGPGQNK